ncbi:(2Fe-2S)-binding protein [Ramlibacter sp. MAHUQ-53]|uniref:(2Fe-2S)-binding protein n=1 Tax=unclassified Ramlibacter TaxID=2617605 RepID=UPI00362820EE
MIVCVCNRVSDREITRHVHAGMDFSDLQLELGVATQCGQCEGCARELVEQCNRNRSDAAMAAPSAPVVLHRPAWLSSLASA